MPASQADKTAVYIHWPYCVRICPYCDFNVYKGREDKDLSDAILQDLTAWRAWSGARDITSVHFGGGTPSLMPAADITRILSRIDDLWGLSGAAEIGLEANPSGMSLNSLNDLSVAGINRLSLGVQTFDDDALAMLGRDHDAATAKSVLANINRVFDNFSLDLIFGFAGQTMTGLQDDIQTALSFDPAHISAYQLTVELGTAFARAQARGEEKAVSDEQSADFYDYIETVLTKAGYAHYEVSNYAKPGKASRHNLAYWRGLDYLGIGPGAHGRLTVDGERFATIAALRPADYADAVATRDIGISEKTLLSGDDRAAEYVLMGLRIEDGISRSRFRSFAGRPVPPSAIEELTALGLISHEGDIIKATRKGRLVLNKVTEVLLT